MNFKIFLQREVIAPIIIIIVGVIVYILGSKMIERVFSLRIGKMDDRKRKTLSTLITNIFKYLMILICGLMILGEFGVNTKTVIASLGAIGVVIGLALQDLLKDLIAGVTIVCEDQYRVGDTVTIDEFKGEVIYLGMKTTKVKAYTGEIKMISNRLITTVINHSLEASLAMVDIVVNYGEDITKVEKVLHELCDNLNQELKLIKEDVSVWGIEDLGDSGIKFRLAATTKPMRHIEVQRKIRREALLILEKEGIELAYPHMVVEYES